MNRTQRRHKDKTSVMTFKPVKRNRKAEDAHVNYLWRKVQAGFKLEFEIADSKSTEEKPLPLKKTMSHRTLAKLISLQEMYA